MESVEKYINVHYVPSNMAHITKRDTMSFEGKRFCFITDLELVSLGLKRVRTRSLTRSSDGVECIFYGV